MRDFTCGLVAKTPCSQCKSPGFSSGRVTRSDMQQLILNAAAKDLTTTRKILHAATKTWCKQINILKNK